MTAIIFVAPFPTSAYILYTTPFATKRRASATLEYVVVVSQRWGIGIFHPHNDHLTQYLQFTGDVLCVAI